MLEDDLDFHAADVYMHIAPPYDPYSSDIMKKTTRGTVDYRLDSSSNVIYSSMLEQ